MNSKEKDPNMNLAELLASSIAEIRSDVKDLRAQGEERMWSSVELSLSDAEAQLAKNKLSDALRNVLSASRYAHGVFAPRYNILSRNLLDAESQAWNAKFAVLSD